MSSQSPTVVSSASPLVHAGNSERRSVDFLPSIWGDHFLNHASDSMMIHESAEKQILKLKSEVKRMLDVNSSLPEKLNLIDQIQRLGISYIFEREIDEALEQIHQVYFERNAGDDVDMNTTALLFRLLRQQGYRISCNVFDKFKDSSLGSFRESLVTDMRGLLSLYEASHLRVRGEDILEEALAFTFTHLKRFMEEYNNNESHSLPITRTRSHSLAAQIGHVLKQCLRKGLTRIEARHYISIYEGEGSHSEVLLNLAKLDFNLLQKQHQKELNDIARWWKELDFGRKLPFVRDRVVECYFWILGVYFEPEYALARNIVTKVIMLTSVMDDIYDVYGTPEELQLLTDAIERWDRGKTGQLPEYMQVFYKALLDVFDEIEEKLVDEKGISYRLFYGKEAVYIRQIDSLVSLIYIYKYFFLMKTDNELPITCYIEWGQQSDHLISSCFPQMKMQARAYFDEAKWLNQPQYIPTVEEYMSVAVVSSGMYHSNHTCSST
ncbi:(-)-germacrene D synthase-like isoform X1 [Punica granatum]|uniref:(-)-germacrene D synthase-like isoform X1 n=1 Tax=Punica granatum TaxID=22663 RepID=A0A6P8BQ05_PUNGR|nr:(-)-germacrene D synthase-like isoform X1 [Punica granatum]